MSHLRLVHSEDPNFNVVCNIAQCTEEYRVISAFSSHVYRKHRTSLGLETSSNFSEPAESSTMNDLYAISLQGSVPVPLVASSSCEDEVDEEDYVSVSPLAAESHPNHQRMHNAVFLLTLTEGRQLSQVALYDIIQGCRRICKHVVSHIKEGVLSACDKASVNSATIPGLDDSFLSVPDPFENLDTPYLREKF